MSTSDFFRRHPRLKKLAHDAMIHPIQCRPRLWLRLLRPFYMKKGHGSVIYRSARLDVTPFHPFVLGRRSVVESFCCINNAVGPVVIGEHSRVGLHGTVIGPVTIGSHVQIAQGVVISGLNHCFRNPDVLIDDQGVETAPIVIADDVWIGANSTLTAGISIGQHSVVAAGSVVTHDVPAYALVAGVPAQVVRMLK